MSQRGTGIYALTALLALLPFARGVLSGQCLYFRDLSRLFFPLRRFTVEGLLGGEVRYWNPFLHEGVPLLLPPLSYPLDLLQVFLPDERGFSLLLVLHVPLGALAFAALARGLDLSRVAAAGGALVYVLGGFFLSTLNLYVYVQAAAWAPLVVLATLRAADGDRRWLAGTAMLAAVALSSTGFEIVVQTFLFGLALALPRLDARRLARAGAGLLLGLGLAAPSAWVIHSMLPDSARGAGLPVDVVVSQSLHPLTLVQVLVGNWHGDLGDLTNRWWGSNFFPLGFPYFLSLYLGAAVLATAAVGARHGQGPRRRLLLLALLGLIVSLGRWAGIESIVAASPFLRAARFPSKAFFTFHLAVALLSALGLDRLARSHAGAWRALAALGIGLGGVLLAAPALPLVAPASVRWFLAGFLPSSYSWPRRAQVADTILSDAALGGWAAASLALLALAVLRGRFPAPRAAVAVAAILCGDLLRTGAGLNPMVTPAFYRLSPETARVAASVRGSGGRAFTCEPESDPAYFEARRWRPAHDVWTFAVFMETLTPNYNVSFSVPTALSRDLTMLVPERRVLPPEDLGPADIAGIAGRLRRAGVSKVLCASPLSHPELRPRTSLAPARIAPLALHVYDLARPLPLRAVARELHPAAGLAEAETLAGAPGFAERGGVAVEGAQMAAREVTGRVVSLAERPDRLQLTVEADRPTVVVVRDAFAPGWTASVDGSPTPVLRADGRHRAVPIPAGRSRVTLSYRPPGLASGLAVAALSLIAVLGVWMRRP